MPKQVRQMKLCITGSFGFKDIGDEAMVTEDLDFILNVLQIPRENIYLIGGQPDYISYYHNHPIEHCFDSLLFENSSRFYRGGVKYKIKSALKVIIGRNSVVSRSINKKVDDCDVLLVTGGGTINTRDSNGHSIKRMHALVTYFKQLGKPIFMSGQTIGPLGLCKEHDELAREIVGAVDCLTVRDSFYSRQYLEIIKAKPREFIEAFDDACALPYRDEPLPNEIDVFLKSRDTVAVNVSEYTSDTHEKRVFIARLCEALVKEYSYNVILISHDNIDYSSSNIISNMIAADFRNLVMVPDTRLWRDKTVKKLISCCALAIGSRYHFVVFAATSNTPFIGMCGNYYSYIKQNGFARMIGLEDFILNEKETWDVSIVQSKIKKAMELKLQLERRFQRPSVSMQHFGKWVKREVSRL